jgi:hypothetical protein
MTDIANYLENAWGNSIRGGGAGTTFTAPAAVHVKLHIGAPGEDGTGNPAGNTTRQAITFGAASNGVITSSALVEWTSVSTTETYSHISVWDNSTAGNCLLVGALSASKAVTAGDTFQLPSGQVTFTLT